MAAGAVLLFFRRVDSAGAMRAKRGGLTLGKSLVAVLFVSALAVVFLYSYRDVQRVYQEVQRQAQLSHLQPKETSIGDASVPQDAGGSPKGGPDPAAPTNRTAEIESQIQRLLQEKEGLRSTLGAMHPQIQTLDAQIVTLEEELARQGPPPVPGQAAIPPPRPAFHHTGRHLPAQQTLYPACGPQVDEGKGRRFHAPLQPALQPG